MKQDSEFHSRRAFLRAGVLLGASVASTNLLGSVEKKAEEVSPPEDLMREHGVLKRILLVYGEALRRMDAKEELPPEPLAESAKIIREFVEDYHEKLEENFLFPRFKKAGKLVDLVDVLLQQHQAGRRITDITLHLATNQALKNTDDRRRLADSMRQFIRMYSPHEAREDTVLFPAFRGIVSAHEFDSLGEDFEKKEDELFGDDGFFQGRRSRRCYREEAWNLRTGAVHANAGIIGCRRSGLLSANCEQEQRCAREIGVPIRPHHRHRQSPGRFHL